jgi:CDP-glucose 4,6-dehydratase
MRAATSGASGLSGSFWWNKRVLVTGHTGFKGSWLCLWLNALGARVAGYALDPPTQPSLYRLARVDELVDSTIGDVRDLDQLMRTVEGAAPDVVIHMAAQSIVLRSYDAPVETYTTNVLGTVHVLEAIRRVRGGCTVLNVTTDKCYANERWVWGYRENDRLGGRDPYSSSKACAELVGQAYRESFFPLSDWDRHGVGIASARAGNVIGGGDWTPRQLVPEAVAALMRGEPVVLRHPEAVRPWQHVFDCLRGYLQLVEALAADPEQYSGEWNFGPGDADTWPVSYLVEALAKHWGVSIPWVRDPTSYPAEEQELRLDAGKARCRLGWRCRLSIDTAAEWVARWYDGYRAGEDPRVLCLEQIRQYNARRQE